jgi:hypothetical protein
VLALRGIERHVGLRISRSGELVVLTRPTSRPMAQANVKAKDEKATQWSGGSTSYEATKTRQSLNPHLHAMLKVEKTPLPQP